ncbi:hypothetical protein QFZ75_001176 [Streptomyces sp. V3I8]|nr:hypothetical protein [Streptomyces sp. V3I8]MDQ1034760.1 hypothetical protein [Streptomyces sp. V3I8]
MPRHPRSRLTTAPTTRTDTCSFGRVCIYKGDIWDGSPNHPKPCGFYY